MKAPTAPVLAVESSETSVAAARRVSGVRAHALRVAAFQAFQRAGAIGLTDDELLMALQTGEPDVRDNSTRPRRFDLERENIVHKAGRTRPTRTGSPAEVYVLVDLSKGGDA